MTEWRLRARAYSPNTRPEDPGVAIIREARSGVRAEWEYDEYVDWLPWTYDQSGLANYRDWVLLRHGFRRPKGYEWEPVGHGVTVSATVYRLPSAELID